MFYERQIKYLDLYDKEEKLQNAGFVRFEAKETIVDLMLRVDKLRTTDCGRLQVILSGENKEAVLGEVTLEKGSGVLECRELSLQDMAGGIGYRELYDIYLQLPGERVLKCLVKERKDMSENVSVAETQTEPEGKSENEIVDGEVTSEALILQVPIEEPGSFMEQMPPIIPQPEYVTEQESISPIDIQEPEVSLPEPKLRPFPIAPLKNRSGAITKWQQLSDIYPHIRPFEDGRDYLKIKPEDFVVLMQKYYPLINNSFLKHGYYNYEHLILARESHKDGEHFYIGVPGNFYEKEKQVAVLFGFESFEGKEEPAKNGDFGYYMISVEI